MARPKTKSPNESYRERDKKFYEYKTFKVRKDWDYSELIKQAAQKAGESVNMFIIKSTVERARSLGVPFENGPFFDVATLDAADPNTDESEPGAAAEPDPDENA